MERSPALRTVAILALIVTLIAVFVAVNHHRPVPATVLEVPNVSVPDDLSAELRRCRALGPQDAEDQHCQAVWEENRRRFFGGPARPLPPQVSPGTAAPAPPSAGGAP